MQQGGARVVAYDHMLGMLVASKPSSNQLFPGYGLVKVGEHKSILHNTIITRVHIVIEECFVSIQIHWLLA